MSYIKRLLDNLIEIYGEDIMEPDLITEKRYNEFIKTISEQEVLIMKIVDTYKNESNDPTATYLKVKEILKEANRI